MSFWQLWISGLILLRSSAPTCAARNIWLLAASAGGLHAVRSFLAGFDSFHDAGFIYAQHIDSAQAIQLVKMINRNTPWQAQMAVDGNFVTEGTVTVVPPTQRITLREGLVRIVANSWSGRYAPNIDEVAAELANDYGRAAGMIVFSGMGDDGVAGSRLIRQKGGSVLVQCPSDCTVPALSEAVIKQGDFNTSGDVEQVREAFIALLSSAPHSASGLSREVLRGGE